MNTQIHNATKLMIAAVLCAAFAAGADAAGVPAVHVKYADLNLNDDAGAKVLYQRIRRAADQVCVVPDMREIVFQGMKKDCVDKAIAQAVKQVNAPALTALYEARLGKAAAQVALNR